ncbi:MAG: sarcosine oxidase [Proteobacteria bacterium]|nr:sarcosine oxidase [Pseudomonadota bacterium]
MARLNPIDLPRRSPLYRTLVASGARFAAVGDGAIADSFGKADETAARTLGLADLSPLPRAGWKGRVALAWLAERGVTGLDTDNRAVSQANGLLALRLAPTEAVLLAPLDGDPAALDGIAAGWSIETAGLCFPVPRMESSFRFAVTGEHGAAMFAKLCAVDLRPRAFPDLAIAQTSVARMNAVVCRCDRSGVLGYEILGDWASAEYLWACLLDAMAEFDGRPVGRAALVALETAG